MRSKVGAAAECERESYYRVVNGRGKRAGFVAPSGAIDGRARPALSVARASLAGVADAGEDVQAVVRRISGYRFRSRFHLRTSERAIVARDGMALIGKHAADLLATRLAPAHPRNDGKQTPWGGHPVFRAQHATGTCCRGCLQRLHGIPSGRELTDAGRDYVCDVLCCWIANEMATGPAASEPPDIRGRSATRRSVRRPTQPTLF